MRMNGVPRSVSEALGKVFEGENKNTMRNQTVPKARAFLRSLSDADWQCVAPSDSPMSGSDYRTIWSKLSGEKV